MSELLAKLGIDWRLFLAQAVNFGLLLVILRLFLYKPILKVLSDRKKRIEEGLEKAKEAETRLAEVQEIGKQKIKEAEYEATLLLRDAETRAKQEEARLVEEAHKKEAGILKTAEEIAAAKAQVARETVSKEAAVLVKSAIAKVVELSPEQIDEKLVSQALERLHRTSP